MTRLKSIASRLDTCPKCDFTAVFMYKDILGQGLCPKCDQLDIKNHKELMADIRDTDSFKDNLELDSELQLEDDIKELQF